MLAKAASSSAVKDLMCSSNVIMRNSIPAGINSQLKKLTFRKFTCRDTEAYTRGAVTNRYSLVRKGYTMKNNKFEIRQRRLLQLLQTRFDNSQTKLAEAIGRTSAYVSFLFTDKDLPHHKNLGEKLARHIEESLRLPEGWLDGEEENGKPEARQPTPESVQTPEGFTLIKKTVISVEPGTGRLVYEDEVSPPMAFRTEWLTKRGLNTRGLIFAYAKNEIKGSRIQRGDLLMLDAGQTSLRDGHTYALQLGDELSIRKVTRKTLSFVLHSGDSESQDEELTLEEAKQLHVIGRVVWVSGEM